MSSPVLLDIIKVNYFYFHFINSFKNSVLATIKNTVKAPYFAG